MSQQVKKNHSQKSRISERKIQIGTAILAFIGAFGGNLVSTYITGNQSKDLWLKEDISQQRDMILGQRIKLIERVSKVINSKNHIKDINVYLTGATKDIDTCLNNPQAFGVKNHLGCKKVSDTNEIFKKLERLTDINAEFSSTMQVASLFFSKKTEEAIQVLLKEEDWWDVDPSLYKEVLGAMQEELHQLKYRMDKPIVEVHNLMSTPD